MAHIEIKDLKRDLELDRKALALVKGGWQYDQPGNYFYGGYVYPSSISYAGYYGSLLGSLGSYDPAVHAAGMAWGNYWANQLANALYYGGTSAFSDVFYNQLLPWVTHG